MSHLELASRFAGAVFSRRLYAPSSPSWAKALQGLSETVGRLLAEAGGREITVGLIHDRLAISGQPVPRSAPKLTQFEELLGRRAVEIVTLGPGVTGAELEVLVDYLLGGEVELAPGQANQWLRVRGAEHIRLQHLKLADRPGVESFRDVYRRGHRVLDDQQQRARRDGRIHGAPVGELARTLMELVLEGTAPVATLLALRDRSDFAAVHSINVATLVGAQARSLGLPKEQVEPLMLAGLLHDIGKTRIPEALLEPGRILRPRERPLLAQHAAEGARLLLESPQVPAVCAVVAAGHHRATSSDGPDLLALELVKLADAFDGIRTLRPFDDTSSTDGAAAWLVARMGGRFNRFLLSRFVRLLGPSRTGSRVRLSSGELAEVVEVHPELGLHPKVRVLEGRQRYGTGTVVDLSERAQGPGATVALFGVGAKFRNLSTEDVDDLG